jgi:hypothetical protein
MQPPSHEKLLARAKQAARLLRIKRKGLSLPDSKAEVRKILDQAAATHPITKISAQPKPERKTIRKGHPFPGQRLREIVDLNTKPSRRHGKKILPCVGAYV